MTGLVRVPLDELERCAFAHRAEIEVDRKENIALATIAGVLFYSVLPGLDGVA